MSTKSLDLSLPLQHRLSVDLGTPLLARDCKMKIDIQQLQSYEQIGQRLIEDRLLLSALELYAELAEAGYEVPCLKQFFSNPGNFEKTARTEASRLLVRSLSQATLDSLDFAPLSEDGDKAGEDRVAVLEFELRKARETITALRENLTLQVEQENASIRSETESNTSQNNPKSDSNQHAVVQPSVPEPMRAYEQRAINFLVHEYLLTHGYRLTSITFADENAEQDFENWDDVGLNMERPAELLTMFRQVHRSRSSLHSSAVATENAETQTDVSIESEEGDLTIQGASCGTEESATCSSDISSTLARTTKCSPLQNVTAEVAQRPTPVIPIFNPNPSHPLGVNVTANDAPINVVFPQSSVQLQNTARALKEELQQGVEDVCQKFNLFFNKPHAHSSSSSNSSRAAAQMPPLSGFLNVNRTPTSDRTPFSLFNSK